MQRREEDLEERERRIRLKILDMQRSTFQESTTRIHGDRIQDNSAPSEPPVVDSALLTSVREQLAQAELDRASLQEEHEIERTILQEELRAAREEIDRLKDAPASFVDVSEPDFSDIRFQESDAEPKTETQTEPTTEPVPETNIERQPVPEPEPEPDLLFDFHWMGPPPGPEKQDQTPGSPEPPAGRIPKRPQPAKRPAFQPVSDLVEPERIDAGAPPLQRLLRLNAEQYALLDEIGYATVDRIASLTTVAVERLSGIFGVPESEIRDQWIPAAQKAVFSPEFNRGN
jgi:hypothetical protein